MFFILENCHSAVSFNLKVILINDLKNELKYLSIAPLNGLSFRVIIVER